MPADAPCEFLEWDSTFFGCRIARMRETHLDRATLDQVRVWCVSHRIDCLYALAAAEEPHAVQALEAAGFHLVDVRLTLDHAFAEPPVAVAPPDLSPRIRPAQPEDIAALRGIARSSHRDTRFYADPHFPRERCDALYETWIDRSCNGYADVVLVAHAQGQAVGYLSCHLRSPTDGQIGLFAVGAEAHGTGVGRDLVQAALRWFAGQGRQRVTVVTQGRNVRAQRLYQRCGFVTRALQLWYHGWFVDKGPVPHERLSNSIQ